MDIRFNKEPESGLAHCYVCHSVSEREAIQVLRRATRRLRKDDGTLVAEEQTESGRYLRVIYREYPAEDYIFVITAYDLKGKAKRAFRRRRREK